MTTVAQALREKVLPNYGPTDPGDTLAEWRACVRVYVPEATDAQIDAAVRDAVQDGLMFWDGTEYRRTFTTPEDPVMAAIRRAPKMSPEDAAKCRALLAERPTDINDPTQWMSDEEFWAKVDALRRARAVMATVGMGVHSTADIGKVAQAIYDAAQAAQRPPNA